MCIVSYLLKKKIQSKMPSRQEGSPYLKVLTVDDFENLKSTPFSFYSKKLKLNGFKYYYQKDSYKGLVIFFHGAGNGHLAYTREINALAEAGYLVYAYDNSCCGSSEGENFWNFSQSLVDQKYFFEYLETDEEAKGLKRFAIGHSWGGFTAMASLANKNYKVEKVVEFSGFRSVLQVFLSNSPESKGISWLLKIMNWRYFGKLGNLDTLKVLKKTDKKVMLIHGDLDEVVSYEKVFLEFKSELKDNENITFVVSHNRHHQPYFSLDAQNYYLDLISKGVLEGKLGKDYNIDYFKLTEEDPEIMGQVFKFLNE